MRTSFLHRLVPIVQFPLKPTLTMAQERLDLHGGEEDVAKRPIRRMLWRWGEMKTVYHTVFTSDGVRAALAGHICSATSTSSVLILCDEMIVVDNAPHRTPGPGDSLPLCAFDANAYILRSVCARCLQPNCFRRGFPWAKDGSSKITCAYHLQVLMAPGGGEIDTMPNEEPDLPSPPANIPESSNDTKRAYPGRIPVRPTKLPAVLTRWRVCPLRPRRNHGLVAKRESRRSTA